MVPLRQLLYNITLLFLTNVNFFAGAQNISQKLPVTNIIGTGLSVDYDNNNISSTTVNTIANVFDGNLNTFFASYERSGTWVGLDLGEEHVITKVTYCPRKDWSQRLLLGVLEGANQADFGDAIPLCLITETPRQNVMTEQTIHCSRGFRYVRYIGPNDVRCNIAELEFYGYSGNGDDSKLYQTTNLPDVIIHTANSRAVTNKETYLKGTVSVISENGTKIYNDSLEIKGRGHASWGFPKKPYRIKLYNKVNLLNLPANERSWTLINNYGDKTLMRNLLAFDLSQRFEMPYTPAGIPVNVYMNGEYQGCYQLCDQIEIGDNRVDIQKMTPSDVALPNLSGGYIIEIDAYANSEASWFQSQRGVPVHIRYPNDDEIVPAQSIYIRSQFNLLEASVFAADYKNPTAGYRKYLDTESFLRHFLVGEMSGNTDTYWSTYLYKKRNDDKFYVGPVWDFDIAFDNDNRTYPINSNNNWIYASTGSEAHNMRNTVNRLLSDNYLFNNLKTVYAYYRNSGAITEEALLAVIDDYAFKLDASQKLNFTRWNIMNTLVHQNPKIHGSYVAEVENVKKYVRERIRWMDKNLGYVPGINGIMPEIDDETCFANATVKAYAGNIRIEGVNSTTFVEIFNVSGNRLFSQTIYGDKNIPLPAGIYMVRLSNREGSIKIVKCSLE